MQRDLTTGERLMKIETDLSYLKTEVSETKTLMKGFIEKADDKYATKSEVSQLRESLKTTNIEIKSVSDKVWEIVWKWGPIVGVAGLLVAEYYRG